MQIPLRTLSSAEAYVRNQEWRDARLSSCPSHPLGGCSFARHGSYTRVTPQGLRIARWYCPEGRQTFSLLPDFVAARLPGLLASIDDSITVASSAKSMEVAADALRGPDISLPGAVQLAAPAHSSGPNRARACGAGDRSQQRMRAARSSPVAFAADPEQDSGAARVQAGIGHRGAAGRQRPTRDGA